MESIIDFNKYNILPLEQCIAIFGDNNETKITFYETVLQQTNKIIFEILESSSQIDYAEEIAYREYCREQIKILKNI